MRKLGVIVFSLLFLVACNKQNSSEGSAEEKLSPLLGVSFVADYPHDTNAFTEGFLFHNDNLFESTGATDLPQTRSLFGVVDLETGAIDVKAELDRDVYFGEGITFLDGKIFQLTYRSKTGFIYEDSTYKLIKEFAIPSKEGWGMTTDGDFLIMSNGTNELIYLDPISMKVSKKLQVKENGIAKANLNELEYVDGYIFANIWMTNEIVKIDVKNGNVIGRVDLTSFAKEAKSLFPNAMEMNGIAYNPERKSFFITGKLWPKIYEIRISN